MKRLIILLLFIPFLSNAQHKSCCKISTTETFSELASNESFVASHLAPLPLNYVAESGKMVTFKTSDGKTGSAFEIKAKTPTNNWIIIFHEWWGLNDYIKREAENYSKEITNANILAVDLYDGNVATTPEDATKMMKALSDERARAIIEGAITHTGADSKIVTLGWCMGGGWSLQAAIIAEKKGIACVMYYGQPEMDPEKLRPLNCDVLGIFAEKDEWINPELVNNFKEVMNKMGKKLTVKSFPAVHAFANPSNPNYDKKAATEAHELALKFLKERIK